LNPHALRQRVLNPSRIPFRHSGFALRSFSEEGESLAEARVGEGRLNWHTTAHSRGRKVPARDIIFHMQDVKYQEPTRYDSVYWIETERVKPNPYQPRKEFDEEHLRSLAESIRQYGILQPLTVTRLEVTKPDGGIQTEYELLTGERRLRAARLIGLKQVPVVIRAGEETGKMKLEIAIIENLQREDLNAIDRAKALAQLADEFGLTHAEIGEKVGKSREFVSNSVRLLALPEHIQQAVVNKDITEGHARALLMLNNRPEEMETLFKDMVLKKTSVRMAEQLARRIATDKIRKHDKTPEMMEVERTLTETLGTRVVIENRPQGGRLLIEFFSPEDLSNILNAFVAKQAAEQAAIENVDPNAPVAAETAPEGAIQSEPVKDTSPPEDPDLYTLKNFSL
jgi:ParB family transcriptional regulator, chromosome partitioning protein